MRTENTENENTFQISNYNVVWETQSRNSKESMPLGGYDVGCNVWAEKGRVYLYVSESGTFDENNTMLKLARICIWPEDGETLFEKKFCQTLHLEDGAIQITAGEEKEQVQFLIWASTDKPEIHIECERKTGDHKWYFSMENWRHKRREVVREERGQCRDLDYSVGNYEGKVFTEPDVIEANAEQLLFYHRNREETVWDLLMEQQHLKEIQEQIPNPLKGRTMGGIFRLPGMEYQGTHSGMYAGTDFVGYDYCSQETKRQEIVLTLQTGCFDSVEQWKTALLERMELPAAQAASAAWWKEYFSRSYIYIEEDRADTQMYRIGRNYQLFRYMLGCNYYGEYPTKFNGGLFTFDEGFTPDYRLWSGGGFTLQNQRLVYWQMLKCGDFDGMLPQFEYFRRLTDGAKAKVRHFFGHEGAFFHEQGNLFGICTGAEYNWKHREGISKGLEDSPWVRLHFSTALEFALMMLEYSRYSGRPIPEYLDYIEQVIEFYFQHYGRDDTGKLLIFPASALETYKGSEPYSDCDERYGCTNPMDAVAGLRCVLKELLTYLRGQADSLPDVEEKIRHFEAYLSICPELPVGTNQSREDVFLPARQYDPKPFNCELPELYLVFPFSPRGLSDEELRIGRNTFRQPYASEDMYLSVSWHQNGIFAARLGEREEAFRYLKEKLDDSPRRFPAFWGPGHDWMPDHNWGGSGMIGLQEMLLQSNGESYEIFPCWDSSIDVRFRLYLPGGRCVEGQCLDGKMTAKELAGTRKDELETEDDS